jgi:hypothetical protein
MDMTSPDVYCALEARRRNEPLYGTASEVSTWLLLEYPGPWRAKAVTDNDLPPAVQAALTDALRQVAGARLLFIRQEQQHHHPTSLFVARTAGAAPAVFRHTLPTYEALLDMDLVTMLTQPAAEKRHDKPLWTVCTNGKRDRCCAIHGVALYRALAALRPAQAWQSSHVGGHRFAPTVLSFPQGVCYGQIDPQNVAALVNATEQDAIYLHGYRGRTAYPAVGQAAEFFLRVQMEDARRSRFQLRGVTLDDDGTARVRFTDAERNVRHEVRVLAGESPEPILVSCGKPGKPASRFRFLGHSVAALDAPQP